MTATATMLRLFVALVMCCGTIHSAPCTICKDGSEVLYKGNVIQISGYPNIQCQNVDSMLELWMPDSESEECDNIRSIGTYCGCPSGQANPCRLCKGEISRPNRLLPSFVKTAEQGSLSLSCAILQAALEQTDHDDSKCFVSYSMFQDYCGCEEKWELPFSVEAEEVQEEEKPCNLCSVEGGKISYPDKQLSLGIFVETCQQMEQFSSSLLTTRSPYCKIIQSAERFCGCTSVPEPKCHLCPDGKPALYREKEIPFADIYIPNLPLVPTCSLLESVAASYDDQLDCNEVQSVAAGFCGCTPLPDHCEFCPGQQENGVPAEYLKKPVYRFQPQLGFTPTCELANSFQYFIPKDNNDLCVFGQTRPDLCGCNSGQWNYLNTSSETQRHWLVWAPRITGIFSCIGAVLVLLDIFRTSRRRHVYNQLVFGMAIFDFVTGMAWCFSSLPIPEYDDLGDPTNIYGARGNERTCKAQAFFIQLGFTSIFYFVSLCAYYVMVIVFSWKDARLRSCRILLHGIPIATGVSLAAAALPYYGPFFLACNIVPPPLTSSWMPIIIFVLAPIYAVLGFSTIMIIMVYWKLRTQLKTLSFDDSNNNKSKTVNSRLRANESDRIEREVFFQSVCFLLAFYLSWPICTVASFNWEELPHSFWLTMAILAPLQGFVNCLTYFRPRVNRWFQKQKRQSHNKRGSVSTSMSTSSTGVAVSSLLPNYCALRVNNNHHRHNHNNLDDSEDEANTTSIEPAAFLAKDEVFDDEVMEVLSRIDECEESKVEENEDSRLGLPDKNSSSTTSARRPSIGLVSSKRDLRRFS